MPTVTPKTPKTIMSPKHALFLKTYLANGRKGGPAAIAAGYSDKSAYSAATRLLQHPSIRRELARLDGQTKNKLELTAETVMSELRNLVVSNPQELFDEEGNIRPLHELPAEVAKTISSVEMGDVKGSGIKKLKTHSKLGAIELASKLLGMLKNQEAAQASVTILLGPAPELHEPTSNAQLKPEW